MTGRPGKSSASVFHMRMLELPVKMMGSEGGAFLASCFAKAWISFCHLMADVTTS